MVQPSVALEGRIQIYRKVGAVMSLRLPEGVDTSKVKRTYQTPKLEGHNQWQPIIQVNSSPVGIGNGSVFGSVSVNP